MQMFDKRQNTEQIKCHFCCNYFEERDIEHIVIDTDNYITVCFDCFIVEKYKNGHKTW